MSQIKVLVFALFLIVMFISIPQISAYENPLQNSQLIGESATLFIQIDIGSDRHEPLRTKTIIHNQLSNIDFKLYGDKIDLSNSKLKIYSGGDSFSIKNLDEGIIMYGKQIPNTDAYKINVLFATDKGFIKQTVFTSFSIDNEVIPEAFLPEAKKVYVPELIPIVTNDFRTFWQETFDIQVQVFDGKVNERPVVSSFEGRLDGVNVKILLSHADKLVATLTGVTANNGYYEDSYFMKQNLAKSGEYAVDVIVSYLNQSVTKSTVMFVVGDTTGSDSSNHPPIAFAGNDDSLVASPLFTDSIILDGTGSTDPDRDILTFSWIQLTGIAGTFTDANTSNPTFTPSEIGTAIFQLTVTDPRGLFDTDEVEIEIT